MLTKTCAFIVVFLASLQILEAVTVKPTLCPSNKIAPHKRIQNWDYNGRTFGYLFGFSGDYDAGGGAADLQEQPQEDDPDDCGEIADYDENDLSSLYYNSQRLGGDIENRLFHNWFNGGSRPPHRPHRPQPPDQQLPPVTPPKPYYPPTRPPYASGGVFADNSYRPPNQQNPSDSIKPVHDGNNDAPVTWQPGVVGGPLGHVVGVPQRPTRPPPVTTTRPVRPTNSYPQPPPVKKGRPQNTPVSPVTRKPRTRRLNSDSSIVGSFIDLLFK